MRTLADRGVVTDARLLEFQISLEELKRTKSELQAVLTRAEGSVVQNTAAVPSLQDQRQIEIQTDLQQTQREIDQARSGVTSSQNALAALTGVRETPSAREGQEAERRYTLLRTTDGTVLESAVTELTQIEPGDLVRVEPRAGDASVQVRPRRSRQARRD